MFITDLPYELQLHISQYLEPSDWAALSLTSRQLQELSEPFLYTSIRVKWSAESHPPIALLLRSLLERPELCWRVRYLDLQGRLTFDGMYLDAMYIDAGYVEDAPPCVRVEGGILSLEKLTSAVCSLGMPPDVARAWIDEYRKGTADAAAALAVSILPNLTRFSMASNWSKETRFLGAVIRKSTQAESMSQQWHKPTCQQPQPLPATTQLKMFENLTDVSLAPIVHEPDKFSTKDKRDSLALFYLPSVQHLRISIDNPVQFSWPLDFPPGPSSLTSLELFRIRETRLKPILSVLKNLETLRYKIDYQPDVDKGVSNDVVRLDVMAAAIALCSNSLRELEIDAENSIARGDQDTFPMALQGSVSEISRLYRLRKLKIPWIFPMGLVVIPPSGRISSMLPPSLEHLIFTDFEADYLVDEWEDETILATIKLELEHSATNFPTRVDLPPSSYPDGETPEYMAERDRIGNRFHIKLGNVPKRGAAF